MLSDANFLILDEPTNHLDITSKEILESALNQYTGTVFFVSHDRYFINQTATRIMELTGETLVNYIGNYDYYLEKREELTKHFVGSLNDDKNTSFAASNSDNISAISDGDAKDTKADWQSQKANQARLRKLENNLKKTEARIEELEEMIAALDEECSSPEVATNSAKLNELAEKSATYRKELENCYENWEEISTELYV